MSPDSDEEEELQKILLQIREKKRLTVEAALNLERLFDKRFRKAYKTVLESRAKRYDFEPGSLTTSIVVGYSREYLIIPEVSYCSCKGLYPRTVKQATSVCYHVLAYKLAEALDTIDTVEMEIEHYDGIMADLRAHRKSL